MEGRRASGDDAPAGAGGLAGLALAWLGWWIVAGAVWLGLTDTERFPELMAGAGAAAIAATGATVVRQQRRGVLRPRAIWLARIARPLANVPRDLALLAAVLFRRLVLRRDVRGRFVAVPFTAGGESARDGTRRALAEGAGSLSPNSYVVAVDGERDLLVAHQLAPTADPAADADALGLG